MQTILSKPNILIHVDQFKHSFAFQSLKIPMTKGIFGVDIFIFNNIFL